MKFRGTESLLRGTESLLRGTESLLRGTESLLRGTESLLRGTESLLRGTESLLRGTESLLRGTESLLRGTESLLRGTESLLRGTESLLRGTESLLRGTESLLRGTESLLRGTESLLRGTESLLRGTESLLRGTESLLRGTESLLRGTESLLRGTESLFNNIKALKSTVYFTVTATGTPSLFRGTPSLWILLLFFTLSLHSQDHPPVSIHQEQSTLYAAYGEQTSSFYDSLHQFQLMPDRQAGECKLRSVVFGYHPYWGGSAYLNYRWELLSDLCYFSYEVNPSTGQAVTIHNWLTDPAIDLALQQGVRVHLCVTLFSGHTSFFANPAARQTLIDNLISLVQQRNAHGVNIDFELVPSSQADNLTSFLHDLSNQMKAVLPVSILSIAIPAVNWNNTFRIKDMEPSIDLFMVMGYDYYWNGSATAGPVAPLYSLTPSFDYSLSRTISAYQAEGIPSDKFLLGIPYYGRQWLTQSNTVPSPILANGIALTYANIRNNSGGNYNPQHYFWEPNSFSSCYIFFQNNNWNQCFIGLERDVRKWYDIVNYRRLAGIGIWALGYDNGHPELWQAISDKFSDCYVPLTYDTLYDSGGPTWNYYANEHYAMTIDHGWQDTRYLDFISFHLEEPYDSLWIYAGPDTLSPLLGSFTGTAGPGSLSSPSGVFTLRFKSDPLQHKQGWRAVFHDGTLGLTAFSPPVTVRGLAYPNPALDKVQIRLESNKAWSGYSLYDPRGQMIIRKELPAQMGKPGIVEIDLAGLPGGLYVLVLHDTGEYCGSIRFIKR